MLRLPPKTLLRNALAWSRFCQLQWQQMRPLNLLHELFVRPPFPISPKNQALLDACQPKDLPPPADIELYINSGSTVHPERLTLSETQTRLKPLHHLNLSTHQLSTHGCHPHYAEGKKLYLKKDKTYEISPLTLPKDFVPNIIPDRVPGTSKKNFPHAGRGRQVHLNVYTPRKHLAQRLEMAYGCLLQGCRIAFHLHQKSNDTRVQNTVDWVLEHSLHLRPDVILMAMPEGTEMLALPAISKSHMGEQLVWALELPEALSKAGCRTPDHMKRRAQWRQVRATDQASDGE